MLVLFTYYIVNMSYINSLKYRHRLNEMADPDDNTITIIYTSNTGAERYMASGWILAHRLGHAFARGKGSIASRWQELITHLRKRVADVLKENRE